MSARNNVARPLPEQTLFVICDIQTRFTEAIYEFNSVVATTNKLINVAKIHNIPVIVSEQSPEKLGPTTPDITLESLGSLHRQTFKKTLFSLLTPEVESVLQSDEYKHIKFIVLMGIETHICVMQSTFDFLERGYHVYVVADGVSSCNKEEIPFALARMRQAGAEITTSECVAFQLMRDANHSSFRNFSNVIKDEKDATKSALKALFGHAESRL